MILRWDASEGKELTLGIDPLPQKIYRVDPKSIRQEGSFYIQAALDSCLNKASYLESSKVVFAGVQEKIRKKSRSYIFATGPSVERYAEFDYGDSVRIVCNSVIFNDDLMGSVNPEFVVFADPIFHFGISSYAAEFRRKLEEILKTTNVFVIIPFKYYPLTCSLFSEFKHRICAIPMSHSLEFNHCLDETFEVKTTGNILTLLMIPLAAYFSDDIRLLGCDGRSFDEDDYFWGHGKSVQIEDEMQAIKLVHPGFFDIDYQDYYFEHCYTLEAQIRYLEAFSKRVGHLTDSFIPAFSTRCCTTEDSNPQGSILLVEPDGIGRDGHYVPWHNQLLRQLSTAVDDDSYVGCNLRQDAKLYDTAAIPAFTSHSWAFSRSEQASHRDFEEQESYQRFLTEFKGLIGTLRSEHGVSSLMIFMFYGSLQVLKMCQTLHEHFARQGFSLRFSLCLFHESVLLAPGQKFPRLPPQGREIILSACARPDIYEVVCVTDELSKYLAGKFKIPALPVMPNPIPSIEVEALVGREGENKKPRKGRTILFPARNRPEKGAELVREFLGSQENNIKALIAENLCVMRESVGRGATSKPTNVVFFDDEINDERYAEILEQSSLVILLYASPEFQYRTSGIVVDALASGKPFICLEGTWLASVARLTGAGLVFEPLSKWSLASAITTALKNLEQLSLRASSAYETYNKIHSWDRLVSVMRLTPRKE